ncbi:PTS sugar transporter subunit IIC [Clostridium butyricum]|uniref:Permease IIC component n=2 Tax=Clostridium butyricum TaxID=1492 RepID=A0A2S7F9W7_CLOBU|nr:PTS sugar transporter subunit IIC [Clostridium butyricum]KHD15398.1 PTS cellobiose transporter subunit IIC [Clostridium butyricum]MBS5983499.1 PTS sugar transporter subunit IIC [Clostridium butyricum]MBZ0313178.1 PTS sugar transporter subunit IIC [Clostridium butyricum]MDB2151640.1 PTS sugar transporter subunit IIC [Clostridium butyricum]PPV14344.1 PTS cellobiose transporter subunit IIC [Clostridium butyricum]
MSLNQTLNEKVVPVVMKFVNLKGVQALKDGMLYTLPLNIIGSMFLLVAAFPLKAFTDFCASTFGPNWNDPLYKVQNGTMSIMALVAVMGMAYVYAKNEGVEPFSSAVLSLSTFLIITNDWVEFTPEGATEAFKVGSVIPRDWMGGKGMITAILVSLLVAWAYSLMIKKDMRIKMPEGVPEGVVNGFSALIPAAVIFIVADIVYAVFKFGFNSSLVEVIYKIVQQPLQMASDSPFGAVIIAFFVPFLWFFGIHGGVTVGGMVGSLLTPNTADNALLQAAGTLDLAHGAHIVTQQFYDNFINLAGSGQTLGLTMAMLFLAKSAQYKQLGRLAITPNLFNINEPILFGTPIVLNPIMGVPFIIVPVVNALLLYFAIATEILPPMGGQLPPWTVPPVLSGLIIGGWKYAVMQFVVIALGGLIYLPFFKKIDAMAYADEIAAKNAHADAGVQA